MVVHGYGYFIELTNMQLKCKVPYCDKQQNMSFIYVFQQWCYHFTMNYLVKLCDG